MNQTNIKIQQNKPKLQDPKVKFPQSYTMNPIENEMAMLDTFNPFKLLVNQQQIDSLKPKTDDYPYISVYEKQLIYNNLFNTRCNRIQIKKLLSNMNKLREDLIHNKIEEPIYYKQTINNIHIIRNAMKDVTNDPLLLEEQEEIIRDNYQELLINEQIWDQESDHSEKTVSSFIDEMNERKKRVKEMLNIIRRIMDALRKRGISKYIKNDRKESRKNTIIIIKQTKEFTKKMIKFIEKNKNDQIINYDTILLPLRNELYKVRKRIKENNDNTGVEDGKTIMHLNESINELITYKDSYDTTISTLKQKLKEANDGNEIKKRKRSIISTTEIIDLKSRIISTLTKIDITIYKKDKRKRKRKKNKSTVPQNTELLIDKKEEKDNNEDNQSLSNSILQNMESLSINLSKVTNNDNIRKLKKVDNIGNQIFNQDNKQTEVKTLVTAMTMFKGKMPEEIKQQNEQQQQAMMQTITHPQNSNNDNNNIKSETLSESNNNYIAKTLKNNPLMGLPIKPTTQPTTIPIGPKQSSKQPPSSKQEQKQQQQPQPQQPFDQSAQNIKYKPYDEDSSSSDDDDDYTSDSDSGSSTTSSSSSDEDKFSNSRRKRNQNIKITKRIAKYMRNIANDNKKTNDNL